MIIGKYSYPLFRLNALLEDTRILHEKFGRKEISREHIAQVLGQKPTSGGLSQKLADLRAYGLLSGGHGKFHVTDIGVKATFGNESEKADALDAAVKNIPLWMEIYKKYGNEPVSETFWLDLAEITGVERPESQNKAETVKKAFLEDIKYILSGKIQAMKPNSEKDENITKLIVSGDKNSTKEQTQGSLYSINSTAYPYLGYPESLSAPIVIKDEKTFRAAKIFWDAIEEEWNKKITSGKTESNRPDESQNT